MMNQSTAKIFDKWIDNNTNCVQRPLHHWLFTEMEGPFPVGQLYADIAHTQMFCVET